MSDDLDSEVDRALGQMAEFDAQDLAIERAEAEGAQVETPELDDAKMQAIIAASLRAAGAVEPEAARQVPAPANAGSGYGRLLAWGAVAVAIAASVFLWRASTPTTDPAASSISGGPFPQASLHLGGTARTLGEAPPVRAYGPGDTFVLQVSFETKPAVKVFGGVSARAADGTTQPLLLEQRIEPNVLRFEGEIAEHLAPGVWTLNVVVGDARTCSSTNVADCQALDTQVEVVDP